MSKSLHKKSTFLNFQFLIGLLLFVGFIISIFVIYTQNLLVSGKEFGGTPFIKPVYEKWFLGTDANGVLIFRRLLQAILTDAFIILSAWLVSFITGIGLGYLSAKQKWLGSLLKEILGFGPTIVLAAILAYFIEMKIYGTALAVGLGITPYMIAKFSHAFEKKSSSQVYYYIIHALFISVLVVQLCSFIGIFSGKAVTLGEEIRLNIGFALKYPHLLIPYALGVVLFSLFPSLMMRGVKNAHAHNAGMEKAEKISVDYHVKEETVRDKIEAVEHEEVKSDGADKTAASADNPASVVYSGCLTVEDAEKRTTEYLVYQLDFSSAILYEITGQKFEIKSIHKKTVPPELISIQEENAEFIKRSYKLDFLITLLDNSHPTFIYPGKDGYDRIYSHINVHGLIRYVIEVAYNKNRAKDNELNRLEKFIPLAGETFNAYPAKAALSTDDDNFEEIGSIGKMDETADETGKKHYVVKSSVGRVIRTEDNLGKKFYKIIKSDGRVIREAAEISGLIEEDEMIFDTGLKPVQSADAPYHQLLITEEYEDEPSDFETGFSEEAEAEEYNEYEDADNVELSASGNESAEYFSSDAQAHSFIEEAAVDNAPVIKNNKNKSEREHESGNEINAGESIRTGQPEQIDNEIQEIEFDEISDWVNSTPYEDKLKLGLKFLKDKDYNKASVYLKDTIALNPSSYQAYMALGHIYRHKGLFTEALEYYRHALKINRFSSNAYNYIGNVFYKMKRYELAVQAWQQAHNIDPENRLITKNIEKLKKVIDKT